MVPEPLARRVVTLYPVVILCLALNSIALSTLAPKACVGYLVRGGGLPDQRARLMIAHDGHTLCHAAREMFWVDRWTRSEGPKRAKVELTLESTDGCGHVAAPEASSDAAIALGGRR